MSDILMPTTKNSRFVLWNAFPIRLSKTRAAFIREGISQDVPEAKPSTLLNRGLLSYAEAEIKLADNQQFFTKTRKNPSINGYDLLRVSKLDDKNEYDHLASAKIDEHTGKPVLYFQRGDGYNLDAAGLERHMEIQADLVPAADVTGMSVDYAQRIQGVTNFRDRGGVYYIPPQSVEAWDIYIGCLVESSDKPLKPNNITAMIDEETASTVRVTLLEQIERRSKEIFDEVSKGKSRELTLNDRRREVEQLKRKAELYKDILGTELELALKSLNGCMGADLAILASECAVA